VTNRYEFSDIDGLTQIAQDEVPYVHEGDVFAKDPDTEEFAKWPYRRSLWTEDGDVAGVVSRNDDFYNVIQYSDILETEAEEIRQRPESNNVSGYVEVSDTGHKMSAGVKTGNRIEPLPGDEITTQLKTRAGHSGFHGIHYDMGAYREICSNGMMGFVSDLSYDQTHNEDFQPGLARQAVNAVYEGADQVATRVEEAQNRELRNRDEAYLVLRDLGIDRYLDNPHADFSLALMEQVEDDDNPTLWETYNAATYALTHLAGDDVPQWRLDEGHDRAAQILDYGGGVPHPDILGENAVRNRYRDLVDRGEDEYFDGERESLIDLVEAHEIRD